MSIYSSKGVTRFTASVLLILHITVTASVGEGALSKDLVSFAKHHSSTQKPRICQIYSRSTKKHIQIFNKKVSACGEDGNEFSKVEKTSHTFGVVTIRGVKSGRYLCMSKRGKLIAKKKLPKDNSCKFVENITSAYFTTFRSERDQNWYIGFNGKNGRGKKGKRTSPTQEACNFLIRDSEGHEHTNELPTYMQEVALEIQRRIRFNSPLKRKRRHRIQTEDPIHDNEEIDEEVMDSINRLISSPPASGSIQDRQELLLRVKNFLENYPSASNLNTTLSAFDLIVPEENPATPDPVLSKGRRRNKQRNKSKKSRRDRRGKGTKAEDPTDVPLRKKLKSAMLPKTPIRSMNAKNRPESPTLASPLVDELAHGDKEKSPKLSASTASHGSQKTTSLLQSNSNLNNTNINDLNKDNFSRTVPPSLAPKVASTNSRRARTKSRRGRKKHSRKSKSTS